MRLLNVIDEDIVNYKKTSMYIAFPNCSMKCNIDANSNICQNSSLQEAASLTIDGDSLIQRYLSNPLTHAIVFGGLEPFDSHFDIIPFIYSLREKYHCDDDVVIYTGYTEEELEGEVSYKYENACNQSILTSIYSELKRYKNIIIKFGRYRKGDEAHFDKTLGVYLASNNQYAKLLTE